MANEDRFKALVHYIIWKCRDDVGRLGAVKLNKALWYIDTYAYRLWRRSISGETAYIKRQRGPVPKRILATLRELEKEGIIKISENDFFGYRKRNFEYLGDGAPDVFSGDERQVIDEIIKIVCEENTATSISELSHDAVWEAVELGDEIPIYAALGANSGEITDEEIEWATAFLGKRYANAM